MCKTLKITIFISIAVLFFSGSIFLSAYFANFAVNVQNVDVTLGQLKSSETDFTVSFDPDYTPDEGSETYHIAPGSHCNQYDGWDCIETALNLCPYLALTPKNEEATEIGFTQNLKGYQATGQLNNPDDEADNWTLLVKSPCFEGECPLDYDPEQNGEPLPQSLKGQTFKCDLFVETNDVPLPVKNYLGPNITYADTAINSIEVTAVLTGKTAEPTIDPVIIVPGIMGSAYKNGELVIEPILHTYDDLIATLDENGYEPGVDLFTFPYEWRDPNSINANLLKDKINEIKNICDCDKVDLVAHSMGGLVAREYIQSGQYQDDVDQVIFLGTPHQGSPQAYLRWEAGEFEDDFFNTLTKRFFQLEAFKHGYTNLFDYIHNRPISSVQELLPIFDYLKDKDTGIIRTYPNNYPRNIFLEALNTGTNIQKLLNSGAKITNIIGNLSDVSTIEKIRVGSSSNPLWIHGKPDGFDGQTADRGLEKGSGDKTVTVYGSTLDSVPDEVWNGVSHINLPRETSGRIFNLLTGNIADPVIINSTIEKILSIQLQSPIDVVVTAPDGKKMGKNFTNEQEYEEIPGAFYSGYDNNDDEYITIPNPLDGEYKIEVQGTGSGGEYRVLTSYISEEFDITTETTGITQPSQIANLGVVVDNDNPGELNIEREVTMEVLINDVNGAYNLGWITDKKVRDSLIKQAKLIIRFEKKRNGKYEVKIDKILIKLLEKELDLLKKRGKINQQAYGLLKVDLKYLINNN